MMAQRNEEILLLLLLDGWMLIPEDEETLLLLTACVESNANNLAKREHILVTTAVDFLLRLDSCARDLGRVGIIAAG